MNQLATRTTAVYATAMSAVIILAFAAVMTVSAQSAPERPTDLMTTAIDHDTVSLTWSHSDPASVDHYQVLSRTVGAGPWSLLGFPASNLSDGSTAWMVGPAITT